MEILSPWRQNHGSNSHILSSKPWIKFPQHPLTVYIQLKIHTKYKRKPQIYLHLYTSHSYRNFPYFLCSHILSLHPFSFSLRSLHCSSLSHAASINFSLLSNPRLSLFFKGNDTPFPFDTLIYWKKTTISNHYPLIKMYEY